MTDLVKWSGNGLPNGTLTNQAGTGDTPPSGVAGGTAVTVAPSTVGTDDPVIRLAQVSGAQAYVYWQFAAKTFIAFAALWTPTSLPGSSANYIILRLYDHLGAVQVLTLNATNTGRLNLYNAANTLVQQTATGIITPGTRYRIEGHCDTGTDELLINVYVDDASTPLVTLSNTSNFASQVTRFYLGNHLTTPTAGVSEWDAIHVADTPLVVPAPHAAVASTDAVIIDATGSTPAAAGALTYTITQLSGTATAPVVIAAGRWRVNRHPTDELVYRVTVTEAGGGSATADTSIDPAAAAGTSTDRAEYLVLTAAGWE